jgi:hypothetical protein
LGPTPCNSTIYVEIGLKVRMSQGEYSVLTPPVREIEEGNIRIPQLKEEIVFHDQGRAG